MAKGLISDTTLTNIGNAIRSKNKETGKYKPSEMAAKIEAIQVGIDTSKGTATATDIIKNKIAFSQGQQVTGNLNISSSLVVNGDNYGYYIEDDPDYGFTIMGQISYRAAVESMGMVGVRVASTEVAEEVGLTADKLVKGNTVLGITGTGGVDVAAALAKSY